MLMVRDAWPRDTGCHMNRDCRAKLTVAVRDELPAVEPGRRSWFQELVPSLEQAVHGDEKTDVS